MEVIVIDDGSTDQSVEVAQAWVPRIKLIVQRNEGQLSAYNRGFAESQGDVIIFLDSDDVLDPKAGEMVMRAFQDSRVSKVHYRLRVIDEAGRYLGRSIPRRLSEGDVSRCLARGVLYDSSPGSGNAYRRSVIERLMPLPVTAGDMHAADLYFVQGAGLLGHVRVASSEPLGSYRVQGDDASQQLLFGNARLRESTLARTRYARMRDWLHQRLGNDVEIAEDFDDFSIEKVAYAHLVCETESYRRKLSEGAKHLRSRVFRSIWKSPAPIPERVGLAGWAVAVLVLPRRFARPVARYVCNPASRASIV
jgi:glycosyltransferase involved in cell wall biosynthesis